MTELITVIHFKFGTERENRGFFVTRDSFGVYFLISYSGQVSPLTKRFVVGLFIKNCAP